MKTLLRECLFFFNCTLPGHVLGRHASLRLCDWLEFGAFWGDSRVPEVLNRLAADRAMQRESAAITVEFAVTEGDGLQDFPPRQDGRPNTVTNAQGQNTAAKIASFSKLPFGWHSGFGLPPETETVRLALELEAALRVAGLSKTNAYPGLDGEIQVTAYHGPLFVELIVMGDGRVTFFVKQEDQEALYEEIPYERAVIRLQDYSVLARPDNGGTISHAL